MPEWWDGWPDKGHVPVHQLQEVIDQGVHMAAANTVPKTSRASAIAEVQALVRRFAEPRPAGDLVKAAIRRASQRLDIPFSRTRDIWYGDARRIDAQEKDRLRQAAFRTEFTNAIAGIETLRNQMLESRSEAARQVAAGLNAALCALGRNVGESGKE
jgi:hypothetical protein